MTLTGMKRWIKVPAVTKRNYHFLTCKKIILKERKFLSPIPWRWTREEVRPALFAGPWKRNQLLKNHMRLQFAFGDQKDTWWPWTRSWIKTWMGTFAFLIRNVVSIRKFIIDLKHGSYICIPEAKSGSYVHFQEAKLGSYTHISESR